MINNIIHQSQICPNCNRNMDIFTDRKVKDFYIYSCGFCGYFSQLSKVRDKGDLIKDLGKYRFACIYNYYGAVKLKYKNGDVMKFCIDADFVDSFIHDITAFKSSLISANLSYLDKSTNRIVEIELTQFL